MHQAVRPGFGVVLSVLLCAHLVEAGQAEVAPAVLEAAADPAVLPAAFDGPAPPVPPAVISRDASGRATVRAVRIATPLDIDGRLDDEIYARTESMSDFIQVEPYAGASATEKTEIWVFFDRDHVYVSARCWESRPDQLVATEMRRDNGGAWQNDHLAFAFDTFYDRRTGVEFATTPLGTRMDGQISGERQYHGDWNTVWDVAVGRFEGGWTLETVIPFKSLRYRPSRAQVWGLSVRRSNRSKNEFSYLTAIPAGRGMNGIMLLSAAATLVGLEAPPASRNLEVKPYAIANMTTDRTAKPSLSNDFGSDVGFDVKYGVTQSLTADVTYNTDFAQVEADEQQVNLTRFSLFFPEKREFFLENQGTFAFGGASTNRSGDTPILFYSRRIGVNAGRAVPIEVGGRVTGRVGKFSLGVLNIQAGDEPIAGARATNFSVMRVKRDILRRSSIGVLATRRSAAMAGPGATSAYGLDGTFAFFDNLNINTYWARTQTDGLAGDDTSYRAQLDYAGDRYGVQAERLVVGDHFNPEVGFLPRSDMRKTFGLFRFSPRPQRFASIRKFSWLGSLSYIENGAGRLETREGEAEFEIEFQNSDRWTAGVTDTYEYLPAPFGIAPGVTLPEGPYQFTTLRTGLTLGQQRRVSANISAEYGDFYSGRKTAVRLGSGRVNLGPQLSIEPIVSMNWVDLAEGSFTTTLVGSRATYTVTPLMFVSALVQHNSSTDALTMNVRLRWEYRPGSELFVVLNEQRETISPQLSGLANRSIALKVNRLLRF
jgi:hypothetical protein